MKSPIEPERVRLPDVVGAGYGEFWRCKKRYRVVKGSRASKKSKTTALWFIYNLMRHPLANLLVTRKTFRTLKDSCFTELKWAANRLKVSHLWHFTVSPLEATYKPTGQKIYFRGLDDPLKVTSITVEVGHLCWLWVEEAYEVFTEADFDVIDESIRGEMPPGLWKQATLTFNPWNERSWIKKRFFDTPDDDTLALTTDYRCNEWLDDADRKLFEEMKIRNPRRYQVAALGNWGIVEGLVYENWREERFTLEDLPEDVVTICGLDYGYTNDPAAFFVGYYSKAHRQLWAWDEIYQKGMSNRAIADAIKRAGYGKQRIIADAAEPKSNDELRSYGLAVSGSRKGGDAKPYGIQWIQDLEIVIHPRCVNFLTEISNYGWMKDRFGNLINEPIDEFDHLMDAMRYGLERYIKEQQPVDVTAQIAAAKRLGL